MTADDAIVSAYLPGCDGEAPSQRQLAE